MEALVFTLSEASDATTDEAIGALRRCRALGEVLRERGDHVADHVAGSLCAIPSKAPIAGWVERAREVLGDLDIEDESCEMAEAIVDALRGAGVLDWQYRVGTECLAILEEDGEWHEARVEAELNSCGQQKVLFHEWQKPQLTDRDSLVVVAADDDDDAKCLPGQCALCNRDMPLTFHHLVPREEHQNYIGKLPPEPWAHERILSSPLSRLDLSSHGAMICRPCHSAVHRAATNASLARTYCTVAALATHPSVAKFVAYARKQKVPGIV